MRLFVTNHGDHFPGEEIEMTEIHGVKVEDYITGRTENGNVVMDFDALNHAINNSATCSTLNCTTGVAGGGVCTSCFMASILSNKVWLDSRKGYVRMDKEVRYY